MNDTYVIKTDNLKNYSSSLNNEYNNFTNGSRKIFFGGYLFDCSDSIIVSMKNKIDNLYSNIDKGYKNINKWLEDYIEDFSKLEMSLQSGEAKVNDSATNSCLKNFVDKNKVNIETVDLNFEETDGQLQNGSNSTNNTGTVDVETTDMLSSLNDEELALVRRNLGLATVGKTDKTLEELKRELSSKTGEDYSSSSKEFIVMQCVTNGIEIQRNKTREELIKEATEKIKAEYGSVQAFAQQAQLTDFSAYRTHKKGSMFDYSKISTLNDNELGRLCAKLHINNKDGDMTYMDMLKALNDKGLGLHSGDKSIEELKQLCTQYDIDIKGGKTRYQLEEEVLKALENREINQYFGITPANEEEKQTLIGYEGKVDYIKYENMSDEELQKLASKKGINSKIYTKEGLIKELAELEWNVYSSYGNNIRNLHMSNATQQAWAEGYSSISEQAEASRKKVEDNAARMAETEKYGQSWRAFIDYTDQDGFYRDYANKYDLSAEDREKLMKQAYKGERDLEILDREVRGIDNRSFWDKTWGTVADFGIGVGEGLCGAVEAVSDGVTFLGGAVAGGVYSAFGGDFEDVMDPVRKHIATDYTKEIFDYVYEDTSIGQYAAKNSVSHDTVRSFGNTIGQVAATVGMMATGAGIAVPFMTGFGEGIEGAYASGAKGWKAVGGALLKGVYNAAQYGVGVKFATAGYADLTEKVAVNVMVDVTDAATTVPIETAIQTTYAEGYYDPNTGEYKEFTDDMSWGDIYGKLFEQNGGVGAVANNVVAGAALSLGFNLGGEFFGKSKRKTDPNIHTSKASDVDSSGLKDVDYDTKPKTDTDFKTKLTGEEQVRKKMDIPEKVNSEEISSSVEKIKVGNVDTEGNVTYTSEFEVDKSSIKTKTDNVDAKNSPDFKEVKKLDTESESITTKATKVGETIKGKATDALETVKNVSEGLGKKLVSAGDTILKTTKDGVTNIKKKLGDIKTAIVSDKSGIGKLIKEKASDAVKTVKNVSEGLGKKIVSAGDTILKTTKDGVTNIKKKLGDIKTAIVSDKSGIGKLLKEKAEAAGQKIKTISSNIKNKFDSTIDSIGKVTKEKLQQLKDLFKGEKKTTDSDLANFVKKQLHDKQVVDDCVQLMTKKYGSLDESVARLIQYSETGDYTIFTRDFGVREKMKNISGISINGYLQEIYFKASKGEIVLNQNTINRLLNTLSSNVTLNMSTLAQASSYYGELSSEARAIVQNTMYSYSGKILTTAEGNANFVQTVMKNAYSTNPAAAQELLSFYNGAYANPFFAEMTVNEAIAIFNYTETSTQLQEYLGTGNFNGGPYDKIPSKAQADLNVRYLDSALHKGPILRSDQVFYSGIDFDKLMYWGISGEADLYSRVGKTFVIDNYVSASPFEAGAFQKQTIWKIKASKGSKIGAYINEISAFADSPGEFEFLIKRNAEVRIDKVYKESSGKTVVEVTIVDFKPEGSKVK